MNLAGRGVLVAAELLSEPTIIIAVIAALGGLPAILAQRRTERDRMIEARVDRILESQEEEIAEQRAARTELQRQIDDQAAKLREQEGRIESQGRRITALHDENAKVWELFSLAIDHLTERIRWEVSGRVGSPPRVPARLREHLPDELV